VIVRLPQGIGALGVSFYFIIVYFYNTHQVLVVLPQVVGGLAILIYYINSLYFIFITRTR
jgi:hypothetical protein